MSSQTPAPLEPHELSMRLRNLRVRVDELRGRL